jgi:multicomponent Na+:H+ antiporter subunit D
MNANLLAFPVLAPLLAGLLCLLLPRPSPMRRVLVAALLAGLVGLGVLLVKLALEDGMLVLRLGGWAVPYGIVLVGDTLATILVTLSAVTGLACVLYGYAEQPREAEHPLRLPLILFLLSGVNLSFLTGDLFNLFVAFEVMLLASYSLLTLEARAENSRQAWPYLVLNLVGSALFIALCGFVYSLFGTMNFAEISVRAEALEGDFRLTLLGAMFLLVFGAKAGFFPLYYWLPRAYPMLPAAIGAFFGGMLTKVGVYVLLRIFGTVLPHGLDGIHLLIAWVGAATMFIGVLGAVSRYRVSEILTYHIASQIGYMGLALGMFTAASFAATILFLVHNILVKSALFLVGGVIIRAHGTDELARTGGLWRSAPWLGVAFFILAASLAGMPPMSGFWGKLYIVQAGFESQRWVLGSLAAFAGILTLMSMLKILLACFWREGPAGPPRIDRGARGMTLVCLAAAAFSLGVGLAAGPATKLAKHAADEVMDRAGYAARVLGANETLHPDKTP